MLDRTWRKATRSNNQGACVEVRLAEGIVQMRDSKDRSGPVLAFGPDEWAAFIEGLKPVEA
jgi:hypothetical protein